MLKGAVCNIFALEYTSDIDLSLALYPVSTRLLSSLNFSFFTHMYCIYFLFLCSKSANKQNQTTNPPVEVGEWQHDESGLKDKNLLLPNIMNTALYSFKIRSNSLKLIHHINKVMRFSKNCTVISAKIYMAPLTDNALSMTHYHVCIIPAVLIISFLCHSYYQYLLSSSHLCTPNKLAALCVWKLKETEKR